MLMKLINFGYAAQYTDMPTHKGFMYIPETSMTKDQVTEQWNSVSSLEDLQEVMNSIGAFGGGFPSLYPGANTSATGNISEADDYEWCHLAVPYSVQIDEVAPSSLYAYYDDAGSGLYFKGASGVDFIFEGARQVFNMISVYNHYQLGLTVSGEKGCRAGFMFITSDGFVSIGRFYYNRNNSSLGFLSAANSKKVLDWLNSLPDIKLDPYAPGGETGPGGGTGTFDGTGDDIDIPGLPTLSAADTGFITLFNPTLPQLRALANYMWSDLFSLDTFKKMFADPMQAILGLSIVPVAVPNGGSRDVTVGNISTGVSMTVAAHQYVEVDCGTLNVEEYWGAYLDYDPYTKCHIYLPYIGTHPIATDDVMRKPVHVVYHIDILSGACTAFVKCGGSVLYQFIGQVASSIPITGDNFTNVINGVLNIAGAIGTMVATGGFAAPAAIAGTAAGTAFTAGHMIGAGSSMAQDVMNMKPQVEHSGGLSGTGGMLSVQVPYMILERPNQAVPRDQNSYMGYPSYITRNLGSLSGYTEVEHIHLDNIPCTELEANEILQYLHSGVIL